MALLTVDYNIPQNGFGEIIQGVTAYLTPLKGPISIATKLELSRFRDALTSYAPRDTNGMPNYFIQPRAIPLFAAGHFARDLGIFPSLESKEEANELTNLRYRVPSMLGCTNYYDIEFFGKHATGMGDHPLTIRVDGDSRGHGDELYLLENWHKCLKEEGANEMANKISDVGIQYGKFIEEHSATLAGLPRKADEFERRIAEAKDRINRVMVVWCINMTRFFWDFLGRPIQDTGYSPMTTRFQGEGVEILLSAVDIATIAKYPSLSIIEVVEKVFPKHPEDTKIL